jgi:hypothetical protein
VRRAYKYRLFTNRNQERELGIMLEWHCRLELNFSSAQATMRRLEKAYQNFLSPR